MTVRLHGGLGNQLFQLLAARYIQLTKDEEKVSIYVGDLADFSTPRALEIFPLLHSNETVVQQLSAADRFFFKYKVSKILGHFSIHSISTVRQATNWRGQFLNGYFHDISNYKNYHVVDRIVKQIDSDLRSAAPVHDINLPFDPDHSCAVHLRLTDFLKIGNGKQFLTEYRIPFMLRAVDAALHAGAKGPTVVFTDDVAQAKELLPATGFVFIAALAGTRLSLLQEFNLLSRFRYFVPSNSTFSFWASMVGNNKRVYFPRTWKVDDKRENDTFLRNIQQHRELFPHGNEIMVIDT
jgi:hypothetical protein